MTRSRASRRQRWATCLPFFFALLAPAVSLAIDGVVAAYFLLSTSRVHGIIADTGLDHSST